MEQENNNFNENNNQEVSNLENEPVVEQTNVQEEQIDNLDNTNNYQENSEQNQIVEDSPINLEKKSNKKVIVIVILVVLLLVGAAIAVYFLTNNKNETPKPADTPVDTPTEDENNNEDEEDNVDYLAYQIKDNSIGDFDLQFLKLENKKANVIYSPLSIKYALEMLKEGANGETKEQITRIVGNYTPKKYANNANMSFANALFIKDSYKTSIKSSYIDNLTKNYNASVIYDSFKTPDNINKWISEKTFKLINNLLSDISNQDFILTNALAIDMDWVEKIQPEEWDWSVEYVHEDYSKYISGIASEKMEQGFSSLAFDGNQNVASVELGAVANRYDIIKEMGENKVRETVGNVYQKWLDDGAENSCYDPEYSDESEKDPDRETYVNAYIKDINENYNHVSGSTDFSFYVDDNVKVFSKDLKEYSGTTLQYIAIMPTKTDLSSFVKNSNSSSINALINNLKPIKKESFKDGYITEITGFVPMFKFDYDLNLINDLKTLGITNIFDSKKADLSNLTTDKAVITEALHKSTIEFSNSGIKAAAVSVMGGAGGGDCGFDYIFEIPKNRILKIDLTFNKPFMFLIVDKKTKEVWFTGSVYEPAEHSSYNDSIQYDEDWDDEDYE